MQEHPTQILHAHFGRYRDFGLYTDSLAFYGAKMFYYVWDVPLFMCMGAVGGLMGAGFCHFNVKITQLRHRWALLAQTPLPTPPNAYAPLPSIPLCYCRGPIRMVSQRVQSWHLWNGNEQRLTDVLYCSSLNPVCSPRKRRVDVRLERGGAGQLKTI